ncbi:unnamed protein product, partial [Gulo gulo]
ESTVVGFVHGSRTSGGTAVVGAHWAGVVLILACPAFSSGPRQPVSAARRPSSTPSSSPVFPGGTPMESPSLVRACPW